MINLFTDWRDHKLPIFETRFFIEAIVWILSSFVLVATMYILGDL